jgi:hypothetical protein
MMGIDMAVPILQTIVGVVLVLLGIDAAKNPPTTRNMLWLYRVMFIVLGALFLSLNWIQYRTEQVKEAAVSARIQALSARQTQIKAEAKTETKAAEVKPPEAPPAVKTVPDPKQVDYEQKYVALLNELSTNTALNPNLRERLIITKAQLGRGNNAPAETRPAPDFSAARLVRERALPYFDYGIKTLAAISDEEGRLNGDVCLSTYQGLPSDLSAEAKAGSRSRTSVGEIKFQRNTRWNFKIELAETATPQYEASLSATCAGGFLVLKNMHGSIEAKVETVRGESFVYDATVGADAKANIAAAVGKLVAAELDVTGKK